MAEQKISRRKLMTVAGATVFMPSILRAQSAEPEREGDPVRHNTSSFTQQRWQDHFDDLGKAAIVADTTSRALHFWSGDGETYNIYPTSVPRSDELTKRGYTKIMRKRVGRQSAGHPCDVSGLACLSDPRHPRHAQDRAAKLGRVYRSVQPHDRSAVRNRAHWHTGSYRLRKKSRPGSIAKLPDIPPFTCRIKQFSGASIRVRLSHI